MPEALPEENVAEYGRFSSSVEGAGDGRIMLGQDIEILSNYPLEHLASYGTRAFEAKDRRSSNECFALLCDKRQLPRVTNVGTYKNQKTPHLLKLHEAALVNWAPEGQQYFAMIFEKPRGERLMKGPGLPIRKISEDRLMNGFIQPILMALSDLRNADILHGGVCLDNIFVSGAEGSETAMLGECISSAVSFRQQPLYEPIERAMAQPTGRGSGSSKDDLYALGMCVAMVARGGVPEMLSKTPDQLLSEKLEQGSFTLAAGREKLPAGISEFLRGVLSDDETQRWDIADAMKWMEGRRLTHRSPRGYLRAARPFVFMEKKYWDLRSIAWAFSQNQDEAVSVIEKDQFDLWVKRNFEDKMLTTNLEKMWEREKSSSKTRLISSLCQVLDPSAPVYYNNISVFPQGYGNALAVAVSKDEDIQAYAEILAGSLFNNWINQRFEELTDAAGLLSTFEKCRNFLTQKVPGYGMERVLYALNKEAVCFSPVFRNLFVFTLAHLLMALEYVSRQADRPENVLDRHMTAFISVREPKMIDPHLGMVISRDPGSRAIGVLRTCALIQRRFNVGAVPGLGNWLISLALPAANRFYDRDFRAEIGKRLSQQNDKGNLSAILDLIDDPDMVQADLQRFQQARTEFKLLKGEKRMLAQSLKGRSSFGRATGRQVAMLLSSLVATIAILSYIAMYFGDFL